MVVRSSNLSDMLDSVYFLQYWNFSRTSVRVRVRCPLLNSARRWNAKVLRNSAMPAVLIAPRYSFFFGRPSAPITLRLERKHSRNAHTVCSLQSRRNYIVLSLRIQCPHSLYRNADWYERYALADSDLRYVYLTHRSSSHRSLWKRKTAQ